MKKFIIILMLLFFIVPAAHAVKVKLPSGQEISLDGMSQTERNALMDHLSKNGDTTGIALPNTPGELSEWSKLISGTIKDVAKDLNVAVNEFVRTPAGIGVAALIIYKVAGKDMLSFFIIPYWLVSTFVLLGVFFYLFKSITVYRKIEEKDGTIIRTQPDRETRYPFGSADERNVGLFFFAIIFVANTIASLVIFF